MDDDVLSPEEDEALRVVREIVAAVRAADSRSEAFPGFAAMEAIVGAAAHHPGEVGDHAMATFVFLTGSDFGVARLDAVSELLAADPVDPRVLDALRPSRLVAGPPPGTAVAAPKPEPVPPSPDAIPLGEAAARLEEMLRLVSVSGDARDRFTPWKVFGDFAGQPAAATPPLSLDQDMCLFEGWARKAGDRVEVAWVFTRQFVVNDGNGEYDHMEHLQLAVTFVAAPHVPPGTSTPLGGVWTGADLDAWAAEVEALEVFAVPADEALPVAIDVTHENV